MGDSAHTRVRIDLDALAANYRQLRDLASPAECAAVVKANGYGLGAVEVVRRLLAEGCRHFFVAQLSEALTLRQSDIIGLNAAQISVLGGLAGAPPAQFVSFDLCPVLSQPNDVEAWRATARNAGRPLPTILQFETGMNRLGLSSSALHAALAAEDLEDTFKLIGLMSHLACADDPSHPQNKDQLARFREAHDWVRVSRPGCTDEPF